MPVPAWATRIPTGPNPPTMLYDGRRWTYDYHRRQWGTYFVIHVRVWYWVYSHENPYVLGSEDGDDYRWVRCYSIRPRARWTSLEDYLNSK